MKAPTLALALVLLAYVGAAKAQPLPVLPEPEIEPAPPWSAAIDAYAGFGVLVPASELESHSTFGGLTRLRYRNFLLGAFAEYTDFATSRATHIGGALGGYLPFRYFVDFEGWAGLGIRKYSDDDLRYGAGGYRFSTPTVSLRVGISDRAGDVIGGRIGAQLALSQDLSSTQAPWEIAPSDQNPEGHTGVKELGGTSIQMLFVLGLDVAPR